MKYIIDTNSLQVLKNYYPSTFASLWNELERLVSNGDLLSVEEVYNEATRRIDSPHMLEWLEAHREIFTVPTQPEMAFVASIFQIPHFRALVGQDALLRGGYVADPWLIARAHSESACVLTEERPKPNAAKIPNVCQHFGVSYCNIEQLFAEKGWRY